MSLAKIDTQGNATYDNFIMANEIEDQYNSHLDLEGFCTVDNSLSLTEGMKKIIKVYNATNGTEILKKGEGNSKDITVNFTQKEYEIYLLQNRFTWYDEEHMTDEMVLATGSKHASTDMFNTVNSKIYAEFLKATNIQTVETFNFDTFVDAQSSLSVENLEGIGLFAFVSPKDMGEIRKNMKDDLKYVEAFSRTGYVGTIAGVNLFTKKDAVQGVITMATKEAVTVFNKTGVDVQGDRDEDIRRNRSFSRKYLTVALTDETKAVILTTDKSLIPPKDDEEVQP